MEMNDSDNGQRLGIELKLQIVFQQLAYLNEIWLPLYLDNELSRLTDRAREIMYITDKDKKHAIENICASLANFTKRVDSFTNNLYYVTPAKGTDLAGACRLREKYFSFFTKIPSHLEVRKLLKTRERILVTDR